MISLRMIKNILTLPFALGKAVIQYFTIGTIYQKTSKEFNTLSKNLHLTFESHLANHFELSDIPSVVYQPFTKLLEKVKSYPIVKDGKLNHYGEKLNKNSYWLTKNKGDQVLVFYHGGGYALNMFDSQFMGILSLYHSLPEQTKSKLSVLVLDYTLTFNENGKYPTQIYEALECYKQLLDSGYTKINFIGDSAGGNLVLAVSRFLSYREDALRYFSSFKDFDFEQFRPITVMPNSAILISPWVEPANDHTNKRGIDLTGDLGAKTGEMGRWYLDSTPNDNQLDGWVKYTGIPETYLNQIDYFSNGKSILVYGDRESLRDGIETFIDTVNSFGDMKVYIEEGGIHDGLFYVEALDFIGPVSIDTIRKACNDKFGLSIARDFLTSVVE